MNAVACLMECGEDEGGDRGKTIHYNGAAYTSRQRKADYSMPQPVRVERLSNKCIQRSQCSHQIHSYAVK